MLDVIVDDPFDSFIWLLSTSLRDQTFSPSEKLPAHGVWQKNSQFNLSNKAVRLKLGQKLPKFVRHSLNAVHQKKALNLAPKNSRANVDEMDPIMSQFHQHFICANIIAPIKSLTFTASTKKLRAKLSYKKAARKMLVKWTFSSDSRRQIELRIRQTQIDSQSRRFFDIWNEYNFKQVCLEKVICLI
jgi:hypothetical protein